MQFHSVASPLYSRYLLSGLLLCLLVAVSSAGSAAEPATNQWRLVNFWSEWCSPCRKEIPMLNALSLELANVGVQIVGVNFDDYSRERTLALSEKLGIKFPTLSASELNALQLRAPDVMPTTYIVSPQNEVAATLIGLQSRQQVLDTLTQLGIPRLDVLSPPVPDNSHLSRVTSDEAGGVYLSWVTESGTQAQLAYAELADASWSAPQQISAGADWFVNWADFPALAVHGGDKVAYWLQRSAPGAYDYDVMARFYAADTQRWGDAQKINTDGIDAEHGFVSMLPLGDRRTLITWLDGRRTKDEPEPGAMTLRAGVFDATGALVDEWELDARVCDCCQTASALTAEGPVVVYRDRSETDVRDTSIVRRVDGDWTAPQSVHSDGWQVRGCPVNGPSVSARGDALAVAWFTAKDETPRVQLALSADSGTTLGQPTQVALANTNGRVGTAFIDRGDVVVSWMAVSDATAKIMLSRFTADGALIDEVLVADTSPSRNSGFPMIESVGNSVYVTWTDVTEGLKVRLARVVYP